MFQKEIDDRNKLFEEFKAKRVESFEEDMIHLFTLRFQKYEKVEKAFAQFFNAEELSKILDNKVALSQLAQVEANSVTKFEFGKHKLMLEGLNDRIKQLHVLQQSLITIFGPIPEKIASFDRESKRAFDHQLKHIQHQATIVGAWIQESNMDEKFYVTSMKRAQ